MIAPASCTTGGGEGGVGSGCGRTGGLGGVGGPGSRSMASIETGGSADREADSTVEVIRGGGTVGAVARGR